MPLFSSPGDIRDGDSARLIPCVCGYVASTNLQVHIPSWEEVFVLPVLAAEAGTEVLGHISPPQHLDVLRQVPVQHDGVGEFCGGVILSGVGSTVLRDYHTRSLHEVGSDLEGDHLYGE